MPNALNLLTKKVKDKIDRRNYQRDGKYIIGDLGPIDSAFRDHLGIFGSQYSAFNESGDKNETDTSSVSSYSTTATMDGNPGAGSTVDKYFYQPVGRRIEKIAFRIAVPFLPPGRIFQYIEENNFKGYLSFDDWGMSFAMYHSVGTVYLSGLSSLVHQTQSSSIIRSSAALSALIRLCPTSIQIERLYQYAHDRVRNARLVQLSVDNGDREKQCYLFLETLSWARPGLWGINPEYNLRNYTPSLWKGSLLRLVQSWRTSDKNAFAIISEACLQFAGIVEHLIHVRSAEKNELLYFFTLFIIRFVPFIYYWPTRHNCEQRTQQLYHMLLSTILRWLDSALYTFASGKLVDIACITPSELGKRIAILGLLLHDPVFKTLLPTTTLHLRTHGPLGMELLPRNLRHSGSHRVVIHNLIRDSIARTQRLLKSVDELEREIRDSKSIPKNEDKSKEKNMPYYEYTLSQARCAHVSHSDTAGQFLQARRNMYSWMEYKKICRMRHEWCIYLRPNFDWDWDTTSCLERLFQLPEEQMPTSAPIATVNLDAAEADTWNISTEATLPKKMKVAYKSATGDTKYETFVIMGQVSNERQVLVNLPEQKGPDDGADEGNNTGPPPRATLNVEVGGCSDDRVVKDNLEEKMETKYMTFVRSPSFDDAVSAGDWEQADEEKKGGSASPHGLVAGHVSSEIRIISSLSWQSGSEEVGEESEDTGEICDVAPAPGEKLAMKDNGYGDDRATEDDLGGTMEDNEEKPMQQVDQISICSVD